MTDPRTKIPVGDAPIVFLDFEASSLGKHGYPIEVAWVFANGQDESHLIKPAPSWTDWDPKSEAVHRISRDRLVAEGEPVDTVARRMMSVLTEHALYATAPSWDGQWLSKLLRAAGLPRYALRLQDTDVAHRNAVFDVLQTAGVVDELHESILRKVLAEAGRQDDEQGIPAHRALADAQRQRQVWLDIRRRAERFATCVQRPS